MINFAIIQLLVLNGGQLQQNIVEDLDVLIIGAGPAGLSTALHLLQIDPAWADRMLVLEKSEHPRPKLCGGGVTRLGLEVLQNLGFPFPLPIPQEQIEDIRFMYGSRAIHVRGKPQFTVFHRAELDTFLANNLIRRGGSILQNEPVTEISLNSGGKTTVVTPKRTFRARIVVGADGSKGLTRQKVHQHSKLSRVARTLEILIPSDGEARLFTEHSAVFDFSQTRKNLQGYLWDFPSRRENQPVLNRGVYDTGLVKKQKRPSLPQLLDTFAAQQGSNALTNHLQGHPIHLFNPRQPLSAPGLLLAGDSAGIDPLFGEGIAPSLAYGQVAARSIQDAFHRNDFSLKRYRRDVINSNLGDYLTIRWILANWVYGFGNNPVFMHLFWTFAQMVAFLWPQPKPLYGE